MRARDFAKIGSLFLHEGRWNGEQIVPEAWVAAAPIRRVTTPPLEPVPDFGLEVGYGYQWWSARYATSHGEVDVHIMYGNGQQRVMVVPELSVAVTMFAGHYDDPSPAIGWMPDRLLVEYIIDAMIPVTDIRNTQRDNTITGVRLRETYPGHTLYLPPPGTDANGSAIWLSPGSDQNEIVGNTFDDIAASAVVVDDDGEGMVLASFPEARFVFRRDPEHGAVRFTLMEDGEPAGEARKVAPWDPGPEELSAYEGALHSEALRSTWTLVIRDGELVATHRRGGDHVLTPVSPDRFRGPWFMPDLEFLRDSEGKVTALSISQERVRNERFERLPEP